MFLREEEIGLLGWVLRVFNFVFGVGLFDVMLVGCVLKFKVLYIGFILFLWLIC